MPVGNLWMAPGINFMFIRPIMTQELVQLSELLVQPKLNGQIKCGADYIMGKVSSKKFQKAETEMKMEKIKKRKKCLHYWCLEVNISYLMYHLFNVKN